MATCAKVGSGSVEDPIDVLREATAMYVADAHGKTDVGVCTAMSVVFSMLSNEELKNGNRKGAVDALGSAIEFGRNLDDSPSLAANSSRLLKRAELLFWGGRGLQAANDIKEVYRSIEDRVQKLAPTAIEKLPPCFGEVKLTLILNMALCLRVYGAFAEAERFLMEYTGEQNPRVRSALAMCQLVRSASTSQELMTNIGHLGDCLSSERGKQRTMVAGVLGLIRACVQYYLSCRVVRSTSQQPAIQEDEFVQEFCAELLKAFCGNTAITVESCASSREFASLPLHFRCAVATVLDFSASFGSLDVWNAVLSAHAKQQLGTLPAESAPRDQALLLSVAEEYGNGTMLPVAHLPAIYDALEAAVLPVAAPAAPTLLAPTPNVSCRSIPTPQFVAQAQNATDAVMPQMEMPPSQRNLSLTAKTPSQTGEEKPPEEVPIIEEPPFVPNITNNVPTVLTEDERRVLHSALPLVAQRYHWKSVYNTSEDGVSINTLYARCSSEAPVILIVAEETAVFGAYLGAPLKAGSKYAGVGETFVWVFPNHPDPTIHIYPWSCENEYFCLSRPDSIAVGGRPFGQRHLHPGQPADRLHLPLQHLPVTRLGGATAQRVRDLPPRGPRVLRFQSQSSSEAKKSSE